MVSVAIENGEQGLVLADGYRRCRRAGYCDLMKPLKIDAANIDREIDEQRPIRREVRMKGQAEESVLTIGIEQLTSREQARQVEVKLIGWRRHVWHDADLP